MIFRSVNDDYMEMQSFVLIRMKKQNLNPLVEIQSNLLIRINKQKLNALKEPKDTYKAIYGLPILK